MEDKPVVMYHAEQTLFSKLHSYIKQGLPRESVEWRRSFGRPARKIKVDCRFCPYKPSDVPKEDNWTLLGRPFFHIFFTECDLDGYKSSVRDEMSNWLLALKSVGIADWLIVVVVSDESKVKTKILRTSIIDKVKNDFCGKQPDRCTVLQEPFRPDSKSSDSWNKLFALIRQLILQSFNTTLNKFEDHMREQREKRQEGGWSFNNYFLLQEQLAFMFEMLGLYEDALVQYDELDALFTQFVLNHAAGDTAEWLNIYTENIPLRWDSIKLSQPMDVEKRNKIRENKASLLDFRNYLFLRQSTLLFLLLRPWEVSQRAIPFMHNCLQELKILQLPLQQGASACWVFLTCLEILQTCESFTSTGQMDPYSLHMAVLWDYARKKLYLLGELTQITGAVSDTLPDSIDSFLHGAELSSKKDTEPIIKLREALSSKKSFTKHYLELSELAMGAYKHIGRIRSAKLISKDLADFYMKCNEPQKAEGFLMDALKIYVQENWLSLADETRLKLADCQKQLENYEKYCRTCVHLAASPILVAEKRKHFQAEIMRMASTFRDKPVAVPTKPMFLISEVHSVQPSYSVCEESSVQIKIHVNALECLQCDCISVALVYRANGFGISAVTPDTPSTPDSIKQHRRNPSSTSFTSVASGGSIDLTNTHQPHTSRVPHVIHLTQHNEYSANRKRLVACSLKSRMNLRRLESGNKVVLDKDVDKGDYTMSLCTSDVLLKPGENVVTLSNKLDEAGHYLVTQVCIRTKALEFLRNIPVEEVSFGVTREEATVELHYDSDTLCAGIPQDITLILYTGSQKVHSPTQLHFTTSDELKLTGEKYSDGELRIPELNEYSQRLSFPLRVLYDPATRDDAALSQQVTINCEELNISCDKELVFQQALSVTHKLHTCGNRKFLQFYVQSTTAVEFEVNSASLSCDSSDVELISFNKVNKVMAINHLQNTSYMWEIRCNLPDSSTSLDFTFAVQYRPKCDAIGDIAEWKHFQSNTRIQDYKTLFKVKTQIEKPENEKKFEVGQEYVLILRARKESECAHKNVIYSLVWNESNYKVRDQTAGLVEFDEENLFSRKLSAKPLKEGVYAVPQLHLFYFNTGLLNREGVAQLLSSRKDTSTPLTRDQLSELLLSRKGAERETQEIPVANTPVAADVIRTFNVGQVYNASLAQTIDVVLGERYLPPAIEHPLQQTGTT